MQAGAQAFLSHVILESPRGDLDELFTANFAFANALTAPFWGVEARGSGLTKVATDGKQRAGILTDVAVMTTLAKANQTAPVTRGQFVRERILCGEVPPPPADLNVMVPEPKPGVTTRQLFAEHSVNPSCGGCHKLMDGIGFGFEGYDAVGRFRSLEGGKPVDATGTITATKALNGNFDGAVALARKLGTSDEVSSCVMLQWFRYALGRFEADADACSIATVTRDFAGGQHRIRDLLVALTVSSSFLNRKPITPGQD
jgi:hypothetical protein